MDRFIKLFVLFIFVIAVSCGHNMLGPDNVPPPTIFPGIEDNSPPIIPPPSDITPPDIEVIPVPAPDGVVFGGF